MDKDKGRIIYKGRFMDYWGLGETVYFVYEYKGIQYSKYIPLIYTKVPL